jgi:uncharacterized protein (TIGR03067 family)
MVLTKSKLATVVSLVAVVSLGVFSVLSMAKEPMGAIPVPQAPSSKKVQATDQEKLRGTWKLTYAEVKGQPLPPNQIANLKLVFEGDKHFLYNRKNVEAVGGHRLDPAQKPKAIDITEVEGPNKGKSSRGIYLLEDDLFIVCYNNPDMERPKVFTSKAESTIYLFIYKRADPRSRKRESRFAN